MKRLLILTGILALVYAAICAFFYFDQDRLLFIPAHIGAAALEARARKAGFEPWKDADGHPIGWKSIGGDPAEALLVCHGTGGFALESKFQQLRRDQAFQVYLLEYPGYGARAGRPSAKAFVDAAVDAIDTLHRNPGRRIWLMGQSIGSGVACAAAAMRPQWISGLVLITPFDSLSAAADAHYPWLPIRLLLRHQLDSDRNLESFHGPVAVVVAANDQMIPPKLAERLYAGYSGPKRLWTVAGAGHNDHDAQLVDWPAISGWLRSTATSTRSN